ncbi:Peptidyl-tRNA hydrolase II (PTH2) family protein [Striga hermonthica]|uniref:peptidyl-tRNA hydrolase n=1 Tax=Striga hermonthica TaxID=68872 RepID=A0A9N7NL17_STRHE|nr:Peptidyl-tRNA hydrolase II (PTH2) family protein [Striga hermonthica]
MATITLVPRCPLIKPHHQTRATTACPILPRIRSRMQSSAAAADSAATQGTDSSVTDTLMQYVVLRRDLIDSWPLGSLVTQGCHASVAAIWNNKDDPDTLRYCSPSNLDSMHKVTLEVKGEAQILNLSDKLKTDGIAHKLWIEQPENIPTCLATKPYPKSVVSLYFKKLKLWSILRTRTSPKIHADG